MLGQPLLTTSNILIALLTVTLGITCFFYYQSTVQHKTSDSSSEQRVTSSSSESNERSRNTRDNAPSNNSSSNASLQASDQVPQKIKPAIAVTPEEKRIVAERQSLNRILDAGDKHLQTLNLEEQPLHEKDQQAQKAIETLEAKLQGLSQ